MGSKYFGAAVLLMLLPQTTHWPIRNLLSLIGATLIVSMLFNLIYNKYLHH